jgi:signal transduction histidine kinase
MSSSSSHFKKIIFIDLPLLLFGVAGILQLFLRAGFNPHEHIELYSAGTDRLVVARIIDQSLEEYFQVGDTLLAVNNYLVRTNDEVELVTDALSIGTPVIVFASRAGNKFTATITLKNFYSWLYLFIASGVGLIFFSLGIFVLLKKPLDPPARIYHWVGISVALIIMTTWGRYTIQPVGLGYIIRIIFCAAYAFTPVLFVHFALIFPKIKWPFFKKPLTLLYALGTLFFLWTSISFLSATLPIPTLDKIRFYLAGFDSNRWFFALSIIAGVLLISHSLTKAVETDERKKILWLMMGLIVGPLSFAGLWLIPQALGFSATMPEEFILVIAAIMPLTFSISIVRHHAMDIYFLINRSTVYLIVLGFLLGLYGFIIAVVITIVDKFTTESSIITSAFALIILALLFDPVRQKVQHIVDKKFFRVKYNYRIAQRNFSEEMNYSFDEKTIALSLIGKLDQLMTPTCLGLLLRTGHESPFQLIAHKNCVDLDNASLDVLQEQVKQSSAVVYAYEREIEPGIRYLSLDKEYQGKISLAIVARTHNALPLAILFFGKKHAGTRYTMEDLDLLKTVIAQLNLTIERIRLQRRLFVKQQEAQELSELTQMQSFFISSVSHDLQTPLTSIRMYIEFLQERENLSEDKKYEYLQTIAGESNRLSKLINNVLDVSRIERGVMTPKCESVNLNILIEDILRTMQYELELYNFETHCDLPKKDIYAVIDRNLIERAIINLISNAIKYSPKEKSVSIRLFTTDHEIGIEVSDKGSGIAEEEQKKIFEMFYRSKDKSTQAMGGAGLGLAIVDFVVKEHKGKIALRSQTGKGSTFTLWLPQT